MKNGHTDIDRKAGVGFAVLTLVEQHQPLTNLEPQHGTRGGS